MSMHDIEGVVEASVYCIDKSSLSLEKKRDLLYNLYKFQADYDTGYTNFRVKDILLQNHYMFALPVRFHTDYNEKKEEFDKYASEKHSEWLTNDSLLEWDEDSQTSLFYFDAGSDTWKKLVENGTLTGEQALPVNDIPIFEVVLEIAKLCQEQQDAESAAEWFRTTLFYLLGEAKEEDHPTLNAIAEILFNDTVLLAVKDDYYFNRSIDSLKEWLNEDDIPETISSWLKSYFEWEERIENDPNTHLQQTIQLFRNRDIEGAFESCKKGLSLSPDNPFLLLYEAIISVLMLQREKQQDMQAYETWLKKLDELQAIKTEVDENDRIIKVHALYYTAYIYLICRQTGKAKKIAEELVNDYQMSEAKELLVYIQKSEESL